MLSQWVAWDADGNVIATLDSMIVFDDDRRVIGVVDFEAHERAGGRMRDIKSHPRAAGSGTWPEWLPGGVHDFKVELDPNPGQARAKIKALVHKTSGHRRERAEIEAAISEKIAEAKAEGRAADLRSLVGGPDRPLRIDEAGRNQPRVRSERPRLPVVPAKGKG